jgi:septal ring factor EnvC (AmiA/AmiB activator)
VNEKMQLNLGGIAAILFLIVIVCSGIVYYYRGADKQLERELEDVERLNSELASETRQLQKELTDHGKGIASVTTAIGKSRKRVKHVYTDIEQARSETERAKQLIEECKQIIEAVKTQRQN